MTEIAQGRVRRVIPLLKVAVLAFAEAARLFLSGQRGGLRERELHVRTAERYTEALGSSKGVLMKAGQMLSLGVVVPAVRPEFRPVYEAALARLRSDAPPMHEELVRSVIEHELGCQVEHVFESFDWVPLAVASVGQVHSARLRDGRSVAVKIQYPGVAEAIAADLQNTELLATFMKLMFYASPRRLSMDVRGVADEIAARITEELNYKLEAARQAEFANYYRGHPFIRVPELIGELCTMRVLTQELIQGMAWEDALHAGQELRNRWAEAIWRFVYGSNIRFRLQHGDPHPGNYLFHEDGSVSFLDFGCVKRLAPEYAGAMRALGNPCVRGDVHGTWRACLEYGFWKASAPVTPEEAFAYWRGRLEMYWREQPFKLTPEYLIHWLEQFNFKTGSADNAFRHLTVSPEYTVFGRIEMGMMSIMAKLHASNDWNAIMAEYYEAADPLTEMGKQDRAFFERQARKPLHGAS